MAMELGAVQVTIEVTRWGGHLPYFIRVVARDVGDPRVAVLDLNTFLRHCSEQEHTALPIICLEQFEVSMKAVQEILTSLQMEVTNLSVRFVDGAIPTNYMRVAGIARDVIKVL